MFTNTQPLIEIKQTKMICKVQIKINVIQKNFPVLNASFSLPAISMLRPSDQDKTREYKFPRSFTLSYEIQQDNFKVL